ncbi:MAG: hypothetical protein LBP23_06695 [Treponema sp.]|jgi:hypothetical protein|nr:hypothetical protein [Treponema sp.]
MYSAHGVIGMRLSAAGPYWKLEYGTVNISEIEEELFRLEYPNLMADHDPDIERYYYLRNTGQSSDALYIFESRLRPRYPDDEFRTALMRSYRRRHPSFRKLLAAGYHALGQRSLERVRLSINYIADKADSYDPRDVFSTIKAAEDILRILPKERYEAIDEADRYARYAGALNIRARSAARAAGLVRAYLTQSLAVVEEERRRREILEQQELRRERKRLVKMDWESYRWQKRYGSLPLIDFSSVVFSPADLLRIEIPQSLVRLEDQTLAYCVKYWNLTEDAAFERTLFLYSRKYGSRNHDVYMTIRRGKMTKQRDDEILASVLSSLVKGYYYSITGDRYLQQKWNMVKPLLAGAAPDRKTPLALPAPDQVSAPSQAGKEDAAEGAAEKPEKSKRTAGKKPGRKKPGKRTKKGKARAGKRRKKSPVRPVPAVQDFPASGEGAGGSVSNRLRDLSGRSYDLYQDRFLGNVRPAIRKVLGEGKGLFFRIPEDAENLIYDFLENHYSDPFMDWAGSEERKTLKEMGFDLPSLNPVIDECYGRL